MARLKDADSDHLKAHGHGTEVRVDSQGRIVRALGINFLFLLIEAVGGIMSGSLALLADAGHLLGDVGALVISLVVIQLARRPLTGRRTFGLLRAEVLGALFNGVSLVVVTALIFREAWGRAGAPQPVEGPLMLTIAVLGLAANVVSAWILAHGREDDINQQGAFYHMLADSLGSVGAVAAGIVIWSTGWTPIDWIMSVVIGAVILVSAAGFLRRTVNILLEATPEDISYDEVIETLTGLEQVRHVHDLHLWTITSGMPVLTAHLGLAAECCRPDQLVACLSSAKRLVRDRFGIRHSTFEVESCAGDTCKGSGCVFERSPRKDE